MLDTASWWGGPPIETETQNVNDKEISSVNDKGIKAVLFTDDWFSIYYLLV